MPKLDEGNIWLTVTLPTPISLAKAKEIERKNKQIQKKELIKNIEPQLKRSSSMEEIERKIIMDLKNIGKSDREIADYLVEWKKQNSRLIQ